jgi:hypothetical protein
MGGPGCALHRGVKETFAQGQLANPAATPSFFFSLWSLLIYALVRTFFCWYSVLGLACGYFSPIG